MLTGPVTVFDGGSYAGDAQLDHLAPGDKRLLSYAVDLTVSVDPSVKSSSEVSSGNIVRGVLEVSRVSRWEQTYTIKNKDEQERTIIVEHPFVPGRELMQPEAFDEKTPSLYRFRVVVAAGTAGKPVVAEQRDYREPEHEGEQPGVLPAQCRDPSGRSSGGRAPQRERCTSRSMPLIPARSFSPCNAYQVLAVMRRRTRPVVSMQITKPSRRPSTPASAITHCAIFCANSDVQ